MQQLRNILRKGESFFLQGKAWVFVTWLGFGSYLYMHVAGRLSWGVFLYHWLAFVFLFFPVWVYLWVETTHAKRSSLWKWLIWFSCFALPILIYSIWQPDLRGLPWVPERARYMPKIESLFLPFIGAGLLMTDLLLRLSEYLSDSGRGPHWWRRVTLDHFLLAGLAVLSLLLGVTFAYTEDVPAWDLAPLGRLGVGLGFSVQLMLFSLAGFFFYYINAHWLVPRLLGTRGMVYYLFGLALVILVFYPPIGWLLTYLPILDALSMMPEGFDRAGRANLIMGVGVYPLLVMLAPTPFILSIRWFKQNSELAELERQKVETELSFLKQQINPHFFFNTLNNLYALSLAKDEQTPEVVVRLAELMRYVIYRGQEATVTLSEEVKYLEDYVALQQIRFHERLEVDWTVTLENDQLQVAPLLFVILVENAFKHGIESSEGKSELRIQFEEKRGELMFHCENSAAEPEPGHQPGIGLENLRRRLELLYPEKYELTTVREPGWFSVRLWLKLDD
jgi:hypothetical protein